ncbi:phospholipase D-like domain-containing protein [Streptomyces sp. DSM 41982]|uniref:Phospholipase D-like domain-containing protein n=1 Tax=Streptomyces evansiae TaxID=3075535 RepID=A0ABD5ED97_9ACTN|nr:MULTISPECIES: phospholipase D-like domain-containing protein [unclassified Streptomyces]MDT0419180.1 phospholipase D-like domain-containing protein [Streptomyces sp. DSM 41982]SCD51123.1 cardiolipin synthase [Streptomyces sp. SolWspMP-sol7th]
MTTSTTERDGASGAEEASEAHDAADLTGSTDQVGSTDLPDSVEHAGSTDLVGSPDLAGSTDLAASPDPAGSTDLAARGVELRRRLERLLGIAMSEGNGLHALRNGDEIFPAMLRAISSARRTVDMMTFVYWRGEIARDFARALAERAEAGVRVRLLLDGFGARTIERDLLDLMENAGVVLAWFRKPLLISPFKQNHRCHRKALVIDESIAFTGGVGIAEEWCGDARDPSEWRDTHVEVRGPAVDGIAAAFAQNWAECKPELFDDQDLFTPQEPAGDAVVQVVRGSASFGWQDMQTLFRVTLESARERVRISTAYFAPDDYFIDLLCAAAARGVRVELLQPGPHTDKRVCQLAGQRHYSRLLDSGVHVWQYQPTMLHTKILTVDRTLALVGSTNFNRRSLEHDEEVMLAVLDPSFVAGLDADYDRDLARSTRMNPTRWSHRSLTQRTRESLMRPLGRFL